MARISGIGGSVSIPSTGTIHFREWRINYRQAAIDTTAFGDTARNKVPGIIEFSGDARGILDGTTAPALPTSAVTATFTVTGTKTWVGQIIVTEINPEVVIDGDANVSLSFEGTGDLTIG